MHQLILLPDYTDRYIRAEDFERTTDNMETLGRGYIQMPTELFGKYSVLHKAINCRSIDDGVNVWAVVLKLYQYTNLHLFGT
jgi:hypothetical protein